ncbi:MAG TPA: tetratricopeptide repeat protein [Ignavibacteriales bacterium]|nr:tetratricopeptide repeat protein [Ignavibacteriales bacterium]HOL82161.1 tetratricopeptide repeat protein [Ignavibacteriales bacterium]HOM65741.1 tetratricopeptide repeat protein [Ignavibacteriales bacterium]HPD67596.1 tetratricopeptide repeat protein [Ignavibacteriales bacterium]HPP34289.1 tetratricopeptide repeat protein [Ignavibacteriales bacterium]
MQNFEEFYNHNNSSPTFVFIANKYIENNQLDDAKILLLEGLQKYPKYPTALILLAKTYYLLGEFDKAHSQLEIVNNIIQNKNTYNYYKDELEKTKFKLNYTEPLSFDTNPTQHLESNIHNIDEIQTHNNSSIADELASVQDTLINTNQTIADSFENINHPTDNFEPVEPNLNHDLTIDSITNDLTDLPDLPDELKDIFK